MKKTYTHYMEFEFSDDEPFSSYTCQDEGVLGAFSQINLFIGPNNSGKSRLLRALFKSIDLHYTTTEYDAHALTDLPHKALDELREIFPSDLVSYGGVDRKYLESVVFNLPRFIDPSAPIHDLIEQRLQTIAQADGEMKVKQSSSNISRRQGEIKNLFNTIGTKYLDAFTNLTFEKLGNELRFYIPILRGLRTLPLISDQHTLSVTPDSILLNATLRDYFCQDRSGKIEKFSDQRHMVFTGEDLYRQLTKMLLGEPEERGRVKEYEDFLSHHFFEDMQIALIPRDDDDVVHVLIGDERQLPIYTLGDGLQTLLICTFHAFMEEEKHLFFIEEPDTYMHPGMQRALISAIQERPMHQFFITTHSNHLLDMTLDFSDISVFRFRKTQGGESPQFEVRQVTSTDKNILRDLGVMNSSVFLTNSTIWVEGITDRMYIRAFLRKYISHLKETDTEEFDRLSKLQEDTHYSFVEYQGSTLEHWTFDPGDEEAERIKADYLCGRAILIADGDIERKRGGDRVAFYADCLGDHFLLLPCKEIENLIPEKILRSVIANKYQKHGGDTADVRYSQYSLHIEKGLGAYLDGKLGLQNGERVFAEESGTLKGKIRFCERAVTLMDNPEVDWNLPEPLREICRCILHHVADMNEIPMPSFEPSDTDTRP